MGSDRPDDVHRSGSDDLGELKPPEFAYRNKAGALTVPARQAVQWYMQSKHLRLLLSPLPLMSFRTLKGEVHEVTIHRIMQAYRDSKLRQRRYD